MPLDYPSHIRSPSGSNPDGKRFGRPSRLPCFVHLLISCFDISGRALTIE